MSKEIRIKSKTIQYLKDGSIKGTFKLSDRSTTHFCIDKEYGWQQWGNTRDNLYLTVPILEQLQTELE